jgi:hypothetical protein
MYSHQIYKTEIVLIILNGSQTLCKLEGAHAGLSASDYPVPILLGLREVR